MQTRVAVAFPAARSRRSVARGTQAALLLVLAAAAYQRFSLPQVPLADPDTWGYLHPALSKLSGGAFQHTYGRSFVYPGWLYLALRLTGDFRAIAVAQHLLGLGTGVLLWVCWERWNAVLHPARLPAFARRGVGLLLVAFYLFSIETVQFESEIRPEAVFPFFCLLNLYLSLAFIGAWRGGSLAAKAWFLGAANLFNTALIYFFKPSFGFAAIFAVLPVIFFLGWGGVSLTFRLGMVAVPACAVLLLLSLPEHLLKRSDPMTALFLPETLLTVHAAIIRDQLREDLVNNETQPYPAEWLTETYLSLEHELAVAAEAAQSPYPSLGFNPDYLMYGPSICQQLSTGLGPAGTVAFCNHYFLRAWAERPGPMLANVSRQMRIFYGANCPAYQFANELDLAASYRASGEAFEHPAYQSRMQLYPPARAYLADCRRLQSTPNLLVQSRPLRFLSRHAAQHHLPILLAALVGVVAVGCTPTWRRALLLPGAILLVFFSYNFGDCLTVAVVHSLDEGRYTTNQLAFTLLAQFAAVVFLAETLAKAMARLAPISGLAGLAWSMDLPVTGFKLRGALALLLLLALALVGAGCSRQKFYSHGEPTNEEQATLQFLNRLRADASPTGEPPGGEPGAAAVPGTAGTTVPTLPPLCFNQEALRAQRRYALQAAVLLTSQNPAPSPTGQIPAALRSGRDHLPTDETLDAVASPVPRKMPTPLTDATDLPAGRREEIGLGLVRCRRLDAPGAEPGTWLRAMGATATASTRRFLLGVVYHDNNHNGRYDPREGLGGVEVRVRDAAFYTRTSRSGGYALPLDGLPENATVQVSFHDSTGLNAVRSVTLHPRNEELDLPLPGLPSADLVGTLTDLREKLVLPVEGTDAQPKHKLKAVFTVTNQGTKASVPVKVQIFLSSSDHLAAQDDFSTPPVLTLQNPGLAPGKSAVQKVNVAFGENLLSSSKGLYVIAVIDPEDVCEEADKTNNFVTAGPLP